VITGVDIAARAIERALERTEGKGDRLTFMVQNMETLSFPKESFDTIIAIDTLYFVADVAALIERCLPFMMPGGQMGLFYTQVISPDESKEILLADNTRLANALQKLKLTYQTWDYTDDERQHWKRGLEIAEALKDDFEAEGNIELYDSRIRESSKLLEAVNEDRISRYLYHVKI
jgi:ubiquinone/menaquinone biosynthesis C-methylase UbiE